MEEKSTQSGDVSGGRKRRAPTKRMSRTAITVEESQLINVAITEDETPLGNVFAKLKANHAFEVIVDF